MLHNKHYMICKQEKRVIFETNILNKPKPFFVLLFGLKSDEHYVFQMIEIGYRTRAIITRS